MGMLKLEFLDHDPETGILLVKEVGRRGHLEVRGQPYSQWGARPACPVQAIHDAMAGWHACILHAGDEAVILPRHPDYQAVFKLVRWAEGSAI